MEHSDNKKLKKDGTLKKSGGSRTGAGRKEGPVSNVVKEPYMFRMPSRLKEEMRLKDSVIKNMGLDFTKVLLTSLVKELKKIPYPEGVQPLPEFKLPKPKVKTPGKVGRPPKKKQL
jgi:hypothetical protein